MCSTTASRITASRTLEDASAGNATDLRNDGGALQGQLPRGPKMHLPFLERKRVRRGTVRMRAYASNAQP